MNFPDALLLRTRNAENSAPEPLVLLKLILGAKRKNDYSILAITGEDGSANLTRQQVEDEVRSAQEASPMDYSSNLSDVSSVVVISTPTAEEIENIAAAMQVWEPALNARTRKLFHDLPLVRNREFLRTVNHVEIGSETSTIDILMKRGPIGS